MCECSYCVPWYTRFVRWIDDERPTSRAALFGFVLIAWGLGTLTTQTIELIQVRAKAAVKAFQPSVTPTPIPLTVTASPTPTFGWSSSTSASPANLTIGRSGASVLKVSSSEGTAVIYGPPPPTESLSFHRCSYDCPTDYPSHTFSDSEND